MKVVFFIDDVNMPATERYGAQPPIELLRQFQDCRGMYDRRQLFWRDIDDVILCAACGPPGGGRQEVTPRSGGKAVCHAFPYTQQGQASPAVGSNVPGVPSITAPNVAAVCVTPALLQVPAALHHAEHPPSI